MTSKESKAQVARRVRALREARGWGQFELAVASDLSLRLIGEVERQENTLKTETLEKLARALEISVPHLISDADPAAPDPEVDRLFDKISRMPRPLRAAIEAFADQIAAEGWGDMAPDPRRKDDG